MAKAPNILVMVLNMLVNLKMGKRMDTVIMFGLTIHTTKENGKKTHSKDMESTFGQMAGDMLDSGKQIRCLARGISIMKTVVFLKAFS